MTRWLIAALMLLSSLLAVVAAVYAAWAVPDGVGKDVADLVSGETRRAFVPIAGLHHARRDAAAGFCVFNDCGVAIETLYPATDPCEVLGP